jgi:RNA polymerase sigma factor (sigma-70 family)
VDAQIPCTKSTTFPSESSYSLANGREFVEASALQAPVAISRFSVSAPLLRLRSDEQLIALFRAGSEEAFRAIHDRYRTRLLAYTRQMLGGSRQDAEDALQDVFFRAYGALRASDRPVSLRAWLYRVAHNRCIDQLRRPVPVASEILEVSRLPQPDPPAEIQRREDLRRLVADVSRLPEQQRSALLMRELQGLSYEELSESLDVSVAAVKSLLVRARGGLVEAADARDAECGSVRQDLALACDRGVRASGLARRHLRDCAGCREYRDDLRGVRRRIAALAPVGPLGPLGLLAKSIGLGGSGAAAGGATTGGATLGGVGSLATVTKVAIVCAAAVTAGGAIEVARHAAPATHRSPRATTRSAARANASAAPAGAVVATAAPRVWSTAVTGGTPARVHPSGSARTQAGHRHSGGGFVTGQDVLPRPAASGPTASTRRDTAANGTGLTSATNSVKGSTSGSASAGGATGTVTGSGTGSTWGGAGSSSGSTGTQSGSGTQIGSSSSWSPTSGSTSTSGSGSSSGTTSSGSSSGGTSSSSGSTGSASGSSGSSGWGSS